MELSPFALSFTPAFWSSPKMPLNLCEDSLAEKKVYAGVQSAHAYFVHIESVFSISIGLPRQFNICPVFIALCERYGTVL